MLSKELFQLSAEADDGHENVELKPGSVLGNLRLLTDVSSVKFAVENEFGRFPDRPVQFFDTVGRTSRVRPVASSQNVSVLKNGTANVVCRVVNDENSEGFDDDLCHVLLLNPAVPEPPWTFKSRLIAADRNQGSGKFCVQVGFFRIRIWPELPLLGLRSAAIRAFSILIAYKVLCEIKATTL